MEETVLTEMRKFLGYPDGKGDGIFCPGGSIANGYAINCARFFAFPEVKVGHNISLGYYCNIKYVLCEDNTKSSLILYIGTSIILSKIV